MKEAKRQRKERHKLDQILRVLFRLSKRMIGDVFIRLETTRGTYHYHVELQTLKDQSMVIRMFRYGFEKALELSLDHPRGEESRVREPPLLAFPSQVVIYLEENRTIIEELSMRLRLPNGIETIYRVPVLRYWNLSLQDLQERRLYALLPLQVFCSRKEMLRIANSEHSEEEKRRLLTDEFRQLKLVVKQTITVIEELETHDQLSLGDVDRMLRAIDHILAYLYRHYGEPFEQTEQEVRVMIKSFIDPEVLKQGKKVGRIEGKAEGKVEGKVEGKIEGKIEVARNLLKLGFDVETIVQATGLPVNEIDKLQA